MTSATEQLMGMSGQSDCYDIAPADLLPVQLRAANERLHEQRNSVSLLANRIETSDVDEITEPADLVPLLFAHTAYKSYSDTWLAEGQWDRMTRWLNAVATRPVDSVDLDGVDTLDGWIKQMESVGHFLSCSSGTTGKPAIMSGTEGDIAFAARANAAGIAWGVGLTADAERKFFGLGPQFASPRENAVKDAMIENLAPEVEPFLFGAGEPITVGAMVEMIVLRRKIADGTARPSELATFERLAGSRAAGLEQAAADAVDALIEAQHRPLMVSGMYGQLFPIAEAVRAKGFSGQDFTGDNALFAAGGLKGLVLPEDYREYILETFNIPESRMYQTYSMREINATFPLCTAGRYHISPWVIILPLDVTGEHWLDPGGSEIEARAAFMDLSIEGHWGGIISGDKVSVSFVECACGHQGPTVARDILRFADLPDGDKISCAGSIDAYVGGVA